MTSKYSKRGKQQKYQISHTKNDDFKRDKINFSNNDNILNFDFTDNIKLQTNVIFFFMTFAEENSLIL